MSAGIDALLSKDLLGKYVSKDSLIKVLTGRSLKWSRPSAFNDPFDCQPRFKITLPTEELLTRCADEFRTAITNSSTQFSDGNPLSTPMRLISTMLRLNKTTLEELVDEFIAGVRETLSDRSDLLAKHHNDVVLSLQDSKLLCLTKSFDNMLMWSHYADSHGGALLLFSPNSADSQFTLAEPVRYDDTALDLIESELLPKFLTGQIALSDPEHLKNSISRILLTKASAWQYEAEWRIVGGSGFEPNKDVEFNMFHSDDVEAVVFGTRYPKEEIAPLISVAKEFYPKVRWLKSELSPAALELTFSELG